MFLHKKKKLIELKLLTRGLKNCAGKTACGLHHSNVPIRRRFKRKNNAGKTGCGLHHSNVPISFPKFSKGGVFKTLSKNYDEAFLRK